MKRLKKNNLILFFKTTGISVFIGILFEPTLFAQNILEEGFNILGVNYKNESEVLADYELHEHDSTDSFFSFFIKKNSFSNEEARIVRLGLGQAVFDLIIDSGRPLSKSCYEGGVATLINQEKTIAQNPIGQEVKKIKSAAVPYTIEVFSIVQSTEGDRRTNALSIPNINYHAQSSVVRPHYGLVFSDPLRSFEPLWNVDGVRVQSLLGFLHNFGFPVSAADNHDVTNIETAVSKVVRCILDLDTKNESSGYEISTALKDTAVEEILQ